MSRYRGLIVLLIDMVLIFFFNFILFLPQLSSSNIQLFNLVAHIGLLSICVLVFQLSLRTYDTLWRYAESLEYLTLLGGMGLGFALYAVVNLLSGMSPLWISGAVAGTSLALLVMLAYRFFYRGYRRRVAGRGQSRQACAAIVGGGSAGAALLSELHDHVYSRFKPYCIIDDAVDKQHKRIHGIPVFGPISQIGEILADTPVTDVIMAINNVSPERRQEILELCATTGCRVHVMSDPVTDFSQQHSGRHIPAVREVEIEDLLGRQPVQLDNPRIADFIRDKTVLVTGGGGSIGSELCRQIAEYQPARLVIVDIAENTTYELQNDLLYRFGDKLAMNVEIASVRDLNRMEQIFEKYRPQVVFHAAAHKHVPLMESSPAEAVKNNVFGTYNTALTARNYGVEKFVLISTDKAVNPTNVMGATKYLCEQVLQALRQEGGTEFAAVRFGNVLGSSGSVVPLFKKQIARGGPVTVTDKRIVRYFMTISEAIHLVLEAGSFAHSGEVFVLDMGQPVPILDLAEKMIRLSGYTPYVDIDICEVGLRPGEKLYEELLISGGNLSRTENAKIFVEERPVVTDERLCQALAQLRTAADSNDAPQVVDCLHRLVPTFRTPEEVNSAAIRAAARKDAV